MPRTGTTSLQRVLSGLRPALAAAGVLYPDLTPASAAAPHLSHQHLGEALDGRRPRRERTELLGRLDALLRGTGADTVLLSYEGFVLAPRRGRLPERLRDLFARHGFAPEALITVKPQDEQINSEYTWRTQFLREGRPFPAFLRSQLGAARLDYDALARPWRDACDGRLRAVPVRDRRSGLPLLDRALAEMGLLDRLAPLITGDARALVENRSPGPVTVEVARRLRRGAAQVRLGARARDATRFVQELAEARGVDTAPFQGVDEAGLARVQAAFAAGNARFAAAAWGEGWPARVAAAPPRPVNEVAGRGDPAAERQVADILAETCARFGLTVGGAGQPLRQAAAMAGAALGALLRHSRLAAR